jgi:hypothetical protein
VSARHGPDLDCLYTGALEHAGEFARRAARGQYVVEERDASHLDSAKHFERTVNIAAAPPCIELRLIGSRADASTQAIIECNVQQPTDWPRQLGCLVESSLTLSRRMQGHRNDSLGQRLPSREDMVRQQTPQHAAVRKNAPIFEGTEQLIEWIRISERRESSIEGRWATQATPACQGVDGFC